MPSADKQHYEHKKSEEETAEYLLADELHR
jgi:hypothetical protein